MSSEAKHGFIFGFQTRESFTFYASFLHLFSVARFFKFILDYPEKVLRHLQVRLGWIGLIFLIDYPEKVLRHLQVRLGWIGLIFLIDYPEKVLRHLQVRLGWIGLIFLLFFLMKTTKYFLYKS